MLHLALFLPPREGMTDAQKVAESFYVPACLVPGGKDAKSADPALARDLFGDSQTPEVVTCPLCRSLVKQFVQDYPHTSFLVILTEDPPTPSEVVET